jgi:hypothetical protein
MNFSLPMGQETAKEFEDIFAGEIALKKAQKESKLRSKGQSSNEAMLLSKHMSDTVKDICERKYKTDERFKSKFIDLAMRLCKTGEIKQSVDWVDNADLNMLSEVLAELNNIS